MWNPDPEALARQAKDEHSTNEAEIADDLKLDITPDDWPQFRNDDREGRDVTVQLDRDFDAHPPEEVWRIKVGLGWSSFAIVDDLCWTQEQVFDEELVVCYELETGQQVWSHADDARWSETMGGDGPRATPTIHEDRCYTQGATGILNCLNALTGEVIWSTNILEDAEADNISWAMAASPLIYEDKVIVNPGGKNGKGVIAYDKLTGEIIWAKGDHPASYAGLHLTEMHGEPQLVLFDGDGVAGIDPEDGTEHWRYEWTNGPQVNAVQPIILGYQVMISSGYNVGSGLLNVTRDEDGWSVEPEWITKNRFRLKFSDGVFKDGFVYGLDENLMSCIEFQTGKRQWRARSNTGYGQLILLGDLLTIITEQGDLVFAEATPEEWKELFRMPALPGKTWNNPAYARGDLLLRNDQEAVCYRLKLAD
jgi:outer membrane protein assembly factor BamB